MISRRYGKFIMLILLIVFSLSIISCSEYSSSIADAGNSGEDAADETVAVNLDIPAWERYADEPITLDWYINYSWFVTGWGENLVSKTITDETGVAVNFITPMGNEEEKLNTLIASGELPDLITLGWWEPQVNNLISGDMVYALNELADEYDPYFYDVANGTVVDWYTARDGNIYQYPCSSYVPEDVMNGRVASNQTFLVRKDIYEAIGSPDMTTIEGFSEAVKKAKEMFPTVEGGDLIPIGAHVFDDMGCVSFDKYLMNFLAVPNEMDGVFYDRYTDPEYLTWLKAFRQLHEEGYLDNCIFVDTRTQMSEKIADGRYFCMIYQRTDLADQQKILYANNPESIYIAIDGPKNQAGDPHTLPTNSTNGWTVTLISKKCQNPERAIGLMDYLLSEHGQMMVSLGVEGEMYDVIDGNYVIRPEVLEVLNTDREKYNALYGGDDSYWMLQDNAMQQKWMPKVEEPLLQMEEWTYPYTKYMGQYEIQMKEDSQVGVAYDKINKLWSNTLPKLLISESDEEFDQILKDFVDKRSKLGYDLVLKEETRQMNESKKRLGM